MFDVHVISAGTVCNHYLISGPYGIHDNQLTASTEYGTTYPQNNWVTAPNKSRIDTSYYTTVVNGVTFQHSGCWLPGVVDQNQYIQVSTTYTI